MRLALLLCILPGLLLAQVTRTPAYRGAVVSVASASGGITTGTDLETNLLSQGYTYALWIAHANTYVTNSSVATWYNLSTGVGLSLTNMAAASKFPLMNATGLNSKPTLQWNGATGGTYLKCANASVDTNYCYTIVMACKWNDDTNAAVSRKFWDTSTVVSRDALLLSTDPVHVKWRDGAANITSGTWVTTNKWVFYCWDEDGAASFQQTNNITDKSGTMTTNGIQGFAVGARLTDGAQNNAPIEVAILGIFTNYAGRVPVAVKSNAWWSVTNYYAGSNFLP